MVQGDIAVQIGIRFLLRGKVNVATNRGAPRFFRSSIGCFHDSGPPTRHHRETEICDGSTDLPCQRVIRMPFRKPCAAEHLYTGSAEVQRPEPADEFNEDAPHKPKFAKTRSWARIKSFVAG